MAKNLFMCQPEIWGGVECTINRVNNEFFDQLEFAGHYDRLSDIDLIASCGIKTLRVPILWEKHQPFLQNEISWKWAEDLLGKIREFGITPIVGLLHHGSGPAFTDLSDLNFPNLFADYAYEVAKRFPFIEYYTPINEPLTTARFSGLYGHWYPHKKDNYVFVKMLLNQLKGIVLAMEKIRKVNKHVKLIQTEDLGKVYSTETLKYQADFENIRRWLTYDFLFGKIDTKHPMYKYFLYLGFKEQELSFLIDQFCSPHIVGVNYYITSERFLDDRIEKYPFVNAGGNGRHQYVDVEAIRVQHESKYGLELLLRECWDRYKTKIAITEIHLNCYREQQLRWFRQAFETCVKLKGEGLKIKAITSWALLGAYGWNQLVTAGKDQYESGAFDLRSGAPKPTSLYYMIKSYNNQNGKKFPVAEDSGWWQTDSRFINNYSAVSKKISKPNSQPVLIVGKKGTLGIAFSKICEQRGIAHQIFSRDELDISNIKQIEKAVEAYNPWAVINAAGYVRVDDAEREIEQCYRDNVTGPHNLSIACNKYGLRLLTFSSDLVFSGDKKEPYGEADKVSPLNIYGRSKVEAEKIVLTTYEDGLIIRTSAFFGPWDRHNFATKILQSLEEEKEVEVADDITISPTYIPDLVNASLDLLIDGERNIWHLSNKGSITWADFAKQIAVRAKKHTKLLRPTSSIVFPALRPAYSVLNSNKGIQLPSLEDAMDRYFLEKKNAL